MSIMIPFRQFLSSTYVRVTCSFLIGSLGLTCCAVMITSGFEHNQPGVLGVASEIRYEVSYTPWCWRNHAKERGNVQERGKRMVLLFLVSGRFIIERDAWTIASVSTVCALVVAAVVADISILIFIILIYYKWTNDSGPAIQSEVLLLFVSAIETLRK